MFEPLTSSQEVVGDIQVVITFVIRHVPLQGVGALGEVADQAESVGQEVDGPDAAGGDGPGAVADLVVDVRGGHHRPRALDAGLILDAAEDSPLASVQLAVDTGVHSKTSWVERLRCVKYLDCSPKPGGFRAFYAQSVSDYAWLRASAIRSMKPTRAMLVSVS